MNCKSFYGASMAVELSSGDSDVDTDSDSDYELDEDDDSESENEDEGDDPIENTLDTAADGDNNDDAPIDENVAADENEAAGNETAWKEVSRSLRNFRCTAAEKIHYDLTPADENEEILPIDVYRLFVTDEIIELMVTETNRYHDACMIGNHVTRHSKLKLWNSVTAKDIEEFLGILLLMGLNKQPTIDSYWSKSKMYGVELIKNTMARNKFELISRFLHFANNEESDGTDRLYKLRPLITLISQNFEKYTPGEKVVIDESLVHFRGRTILRQYIPNKAHRYGLKFYKLCAINGYVWRFIIYKGKGDTAPGLGHSEHITLALMEGLLREGRTLYVDNFYSSVVLARELQKKSTYVCGTLRSNRKYLPHEVTKKKLKKGDVVGRQNHEGIKVLKWMDKRDVLMLTTVPEHTTEKKKAGKRNPEREVGKPQCVLDYNDAKKGVDYSDQMASYYSPLRKTRKWYKKAAFELLLGTSVVNACILFNKYHTNKQMSVKNFRESLIQSLLTGKPQEKVSKGRDRSLVSGNRSLHTLIEMDGKCRDTRKRCRGCYESISNAEGSKVAGKKARRVKTYCGKCEDKPFLCPSCFERLHEG